MKKTMVFIVLLMVFVSVSGFSEWLEAEFTFQAGWIPEGNVLFYSPNLNTVKLENAFDATFKIDIKIASFIKIGGTCITMFSSAKYDTSLPVNFWPTGMTYLVYAGIEPVKGFSVIAEHSCSHPVSAYASDLSSFYKGSSLLDSSYTRIFIELKGKSSF